MDTKVMVFSSVREHLEPFLENSWRHLKYTRIENLEDSLRRTVKRVAELFLLRDG